METKRELTYEEQVKGLSFLKDVILHVNQYMSAAIESANHTCHVTDEEFWDHLFLSTSRNKYITVIETQELSRTPCPENPYEHLDFQGCNKYLLFGGNRLVSEENDRRIYAKDSYSFFKVFNIGYREAPLRQKDGTWLPTGPHDEYRSVLQAAIEIRNEKYAHDTVSRIRSITLESLQQDLENLRALTKPIARKHGWEKGRQPVSEYWQEQEKVFQAQFGCVPLSLTELAQELFTTESDLTAQQSQAMDQAVEFLNLDCQQGKVYGQERRQLLEKLRHVPAVAALLGTSAVRTAEEAAARAAAPAPAAPAPQSIPQPLWKPLHTSAAALLRRAGPVLPCREDLLAALLDSFVLLVDETLFLSAEGRELLTEHLAPLLMKRHQKLHVDASVVSTLFQQFRKSVPYTPLELSELDPEMAPALQDLRRQMHKTSKTAIKTLRFLQERRCLEVVVSPTESPYSYENLRYLAHAYPASRFLVMTLDRQLAEELQDVPGRNAVVMKPSLDGQLLPFRATRPVFQAMLTASEDQTSGQQRPESACASFPRASRSVTPPKAGDRVVLEQPDGARLEVRLGKALGQGGEGTIYETSREGLVAKIYFARQLDVQRQEKLRQMVLQDPQIPGLCWPQALLYNTAGDWVGYLMPRAEGRELALTVFHPGRNNSTITAQGWTRRSLALIAANIAATFQRMHEKGILMGDINPRNFLVTPQCAVYLVDCDSYQFGGFSCPVGTPLYTPPEVHRSMRAAGVENYGYIRTEDNERYSLAVLLFEILMLGKAPYESCNTNNQDVIDAIIEGNFPYPYRTGEDEEEERLRGNIKAPVGKWRQIWSNTTYLVKTGFYNTFTGKNRLSAAEWAQVLREYARQIELGHSSDDLTPDGYKDTSGRDGEDATKMVDLICRKCGRPFNLGEDVYRRRKSRGEPDLCATHWAIRQNLRRREKLVVCGICGAQFQTNVAEWIERTEAQKPMVCPQCANVTVTCSRCGRTYQEKRERAEDLRSRGVSLLCPDCFDLSFPRTVCERCGEVFRPHRDWLEARRRSGGAVLCKRCQSKPDSSRQ